MPKKVLVTGGTGYIGSHTIVDLLTKGFDVVSIDNGSNSNEASLEGIQQITGRRPNHYHSDLCNIQELRQIFENHPEIEGIIHFAALKAVGESVEKPLLYFRNNIVSLLNLLEVAIESKVKAFVFSSSCTVYGDVTVSPVDELTPWQEAASPYGRTKQMGEQIICDTLQNSDMKAILLRYFNPAGAHPSNFIGESPENKAQNLVPVITETAIGKRDEMTVFGNDYPTFDGSCIRDYIHVCDLADAHTKALDYIFKDVQKQNIEIFNLGIGQGLSVLQIIEAFEQETGVTLSYKIGPRRPGDVAAIFANISKARQLLHWNPIYGAKDIMRTAWAWEKKRSQLA
jgi:UDP-glucose 4-epimerase